MSLTIKTRRIAAGYYEVDTPKGTYGVARTLPKSETGWPTAWAITYPGEWFADDVANTLREAKEIIAADQEA